MRMRRSGSERARCQRSTLTTVRRSCSPVPSRRDVRCAECRRWIQHETQVRSSTSIAGQSGNKLIEPVPGPSDDASPCATPRQRQDGRRKRRTASTIGTGSCAMRCAPVHRVAKHRPANRPFCKENARSPRHYGSKSRLKGVVRETAPTRTVVKHGRPITLLWAEPARTTARWIRFVRCAPREQFRLPCR